MIKHTTVWFVLVCLLLTATARAWAEEQHEHKRESCRVCGMWIDEYQKSAAELTWKDGTKRYTCGVACMLREIEDAGGMGAFQTVLVHDWVSGKLVDAETASYVVGSKVIPDMIPNYIAFAKREEAEAFIAKEGGDLMTLAMALEDSSPRGNTVPFRIRTAVTPAMGAFSMAGIYGYTQKDSLKVGESGRDPTGFIKANPSQPRVPKEIQVHRQSLAFNYSPTDNLAIFLNMPWFERRFTSLERNPATKQIVQNVNNQDGLGDFDLEFRYNLWRGTRFDKWFTLFLATSLPTGHFEDKRRLDAVNKKYMIATAPGLQLGKGTATFTGGLLYSQRWENFWFHGSTLYQVNPENDDDYAYGDQALIGLGIHYTPTYDVMFGVEMDATYTEKNQDMGIKIGNTGGTQANVAAVVDWRFANALGGNFNLRASAGVPFYEDLNSKSAINPTSGKPFTQVQLGEGFFANIAINWQTRFLPD